MPKVEIELSSNALITGDVVYEDTSFDHEFGTKKNHAINVENVSVIVFIDGMDYDVTAAFTKTDKGFNERMYEGFINQLEKKARQEYADRAS